MTLDALARGEPSDVAVIGGGINGAAIAREAAGRGLRVVLFEQDDFGFGTTWRSTKLIHGGLRYLEHGDIRLVYESLRERAWLLKTRPHLVEPLRLLLPVLPWTRRPRWQLRAGLELYDLLSLYRGVPRHRALSEAELRAHAPALSPEAQGGFSFFDARVVAPERLALELALEAREMGAELFNHARVTRIETVKGAVSAVQVEHEGRTATIPAHAVVNAAGPWVDAVNRLTGEARGGLLGVTRGSHIVCEVEAPLPSEAIFSTARSDGRVFFAVPQGPLIRIGTTDERYDGNPGEARPTGDEVRYLLAEAQELLPGLGLGRADVRYAYTGLRPLRRMEGGPEAAITRRHEVIRHEKRGGPTGLLSVIGGKLSTFRPLAREAVDALEMGRRQKLPEPAGPACPELPEGLELPEASRRHLRVYGAALPAVLAGGTSLLCEHSGAIEGEVRHAVEEEQASTLSDILMRRTGIAWSSCRGLCCHRRVAAIAAPSLGWDAGRVGREVAAFEADVQKHLPAPDELERGG
jgi:glycerol-3-phosphate dehydrogenase